MNRNEQGYRPPPDHPLGHSPPRSTKEYTRDQRRPPPDSQVYVHDDRYRRAGLQGRDKGKERRRASDSDEQVHEQFTRKEELRPKSPPAIVVNPNYYEQTIAPNKPPITKHPSTRRTPDGPGVPPPLRGVLKEEVPSDLSTSIGATPRPSLAKDSSEERSWSSSSPSSPSSNERFSPLRSRHDPRSTSFSNVDGEIHLPLQRDNTIPPTRYGERPNPPTHYSGESSSVQRPSRITLGHKKTLSPLGLVPENSYPPARPDPRGRVESRNPPVNISRASDAARDFTRSSDRPVGRRYAGPPPRNPAPATSPV